MNDIIDGFFPWELKGEFPDGVPFVLRDRHEEWFDVRKENKFVAFEGRGVVVGKQENESDDEEAGDDGELVNVTVPIPKNGTWTMNDDADAVDKSKV